MTDQLDLFHVDDGPGWYTVTGKGVRGRAKATWSQFSWLGYYDSEHDALEAGRRRDRALTIAGEHEVTVKRYDGIPPFALDREAVWIAAERGMPLTTDDGHRYRCEGERIHPDAIRKASA